MNPTTKQRKNEAKSVLRYVYIILSLIFHSRPHLFPLISTLAPSRKAILGHSVAAGRQVGSPGDPLGRLLKQRVVVDVCQSGDGGGAVGATDVDLTAVVHTERAVHVERAAQEAAQTRPGGTSGSQVRWGCGSARRVTENRHRNQGTGYVKMLGTLVFRQNLSGSPVDDPVGGLRAEAGQGADGGVRGGQVRQLAGAAAEAALGRLAAAEEGGDRVRPLHGQRVAQHVQRVQHPVAEPRPAGVQTLAGG